MFPQTLKILIADSDSSRAQLLTDKLEQSSIQSFEVVFASSLAAAVRALNDGTISVVLSRLDLGDANGLDALLRYREVRDEIPVITFIDSEQARHLLSAVRSLSDDCLLGDSFTADSLSVAISTSLDRRKMTQKLRKPMGSVTIAPESDGVRELFNHLDQVVFLVDSDSGNLLFSNSLAEKWFGDSIASVLAVIFEYGVLNSAELEVEISLSCQHAANAEMRSVSIDWEGRDCCLISLRNIMKRKRAESACKYAQRRLELALKASNVGFWSWDLRGQQLQYSERWKAQIGYKNKEFPNTLSAYRDAIHPDDRSIAVDEFRRFLKGDVKVLEQKFRLRHANGTYRFILGRAEVFPDGEGKLALILGTHVDITEKRIADQRMSELRSVKSSEGAEISNMIHARIEKYASEATYGAESIQGHFRSDSKIVQKIRNIGFNSQRIAKLNKWLSLASVDSEISGSQIELASILVRNLDDLSLLLPAKAELHLDSVSRVFVDGLKPDDLRLIVAEAISVVGEYIHAEYRSKVIVCVSGESEKRLEIEYLGVALTGEDLRSMSRPSSVTASAIGKGERSVLVLRFDTNQIQETSLPATKRGSNPVALLAEDEGVLRLAVQSMLESIGYDVLIAEDGESAIEQFAKHRDTITFAMVDLHMPGKGGQHVVDAIRLNDPHLPIVKMSGDDAESVGDIFGLVDSHCCFLSKPFGVADLKQAIASLSKLSKLTS